MNSHNWTLKLFYLISIFKFFGNVSPSTSSVEGETLPIDAAEGAIYDAEGEGTSAEGEETLIEGKISDLTWSFVSS